MITTADGAEVVQSLDGVELERPPLLVIDRLTDYFDRSGLGAGPLAWQRIGEGQSNITYRIWRGEDTFVLRRGPRPPLPKSTHDMLREARILQALRPHGVLVPEVLDVCPDEDVLGVPFYVMEWLDGHVITDDVPDELNVEPVRRQTTGAMVRTLAHLHCVDTSATGVASLGRSDGYLSRQISRFSGLWETHAGRDLPQVAWLADWLERNIPQSQRASVVHGDYRLGNLMFKSTSPATPVAVLDWEMATLGDPLSDLGYMVATYTEAGSAWNPLHMSPVTARRGYHSRSELIAEYADLTGLDVANLDWYRVLALWKAAVFCEAIYDRWVRGERPGDTFGPQLEGGVPALLAEARLLAG